MGFRRAGPVPVLVLLVLLLGINRSVIFFGFTKSSDLDGWNGVNCPCNTSVEQHYPKKRVLVGFFCKAGQAERRALIRSVLHRKYNPSLVDITFVIGQSSDEVDNQLVTLEHRLHGDIFQLSIKENMDEGKTFAFFKAVYERRQSGGKSYDFVVKADSDSFIHPLNLLKRLEQIFPERAYIGCMVKNFGITYATGMAYILSSDLVQAIATLDYAAENTIGFEDVQTGKWLDYISGKLGQPIHFYNDCDHFRDHPLSGAGFARPFNPDAIAVHWLKTNAIYIETVLHYYPETFING